MANRNTNGSHDFGVAQINSAWLDKTEAAGIDAAALKNNSCANIWAAGWIMRRCMNKFKTSFWHAVGCYHTGENPKSKAQLSRQRSYARKVHVAIERIRVPFNAWLSGGSAQ